MARVPCCLALAVVAEPLLSPAPTDPPHGFPVPPNLLVYRLPTNPCCPAVVPTALQASSPARAGSKSSSRNVHVDICNGTRESKPLHGESVTTTKPRCNSGIYAALPWCRIQPLPLLILAPATNLPAIVFRNWILAQTLAVSAAFKRVQMSHIHLCVHPT